MDHGKSKIGEMQFVDGTVIEVWCYYDGETYYPVLQFKGKKFNVKMSGMSTNFTNFIRFLQECERRIYSESGIDPKIIEEQRKRLPDLSKGNEHNDIKFFL